MNSLGLFWQETFENKHESLETAFFDLGQKINWELFKPFLDKGLGRLERDLKRGGRPNFDPTKIFKILILQHYYQMSDDAMEFQLYDGLSFRQFVGFLDGDRIPDSKTIWLFRDTLAQAEVIQPLFKIFGKALDNLGLIAQGVDRSASAARSRVRAHVEHVFAAGKNWGKRIQIRTIGQARATFTRGLGNLIHNMRRLIFFEKMELLRHKCA